MFDPVEASKWGIVDFDWSNAKQLWANTKPMDCQERLVSQVEQVKRVNNQTRTFVYRNLVKALPWYTSVREKLEDPAYSGFFLKFSDGINGSYHTNPCTDGKCSEFYHDQDQTPEHPKGDGSCVDTCDCGSIPCGEYLWDHRNGTMLREFLLHEFVLGPDGMANPNIDGIFLDDGWTDSPEERASWWPKEGFCSADVIGGPTEEYPNCTLDMGLTQADTTLIKSEWQKTISAVQSSIVSAGGFNWQLFEQSTDLPNNSTECRAYFADACRSGGGKRTHVPWVYQFSDAKSGKAGMTKVKEDVVTFLLARGDYAWIGYGWIGCLAEYFRPPEVDVDYGEPLDFCSEKEDGVFVRELSKATVLFDCDKMNAEIVMKK